MKNSISRSRKTSIALSIILCSGSSLATTLGATAVGTTTHASSEEESKASKEPVPVGIPKMKKGRFVQEVAYGDKKLSLHGTGLCEWGIFGINLYWAALYVEKRPETKESLLRADQTLVIHLEFSRALTGEQLGDAYEASIKLNAGKKIATYRAGLAQLKTMLKTVKADERYTFIAQPGKGITVQRESKVIGVIKSDAFRLLFVKLYLGDKPPTKALRKGLLGNLR